MSNTQRFSFGLRGLALLLCACLLTLPAIASATDAGGAESPQALAKRMQKAAESNDFAEMAACIAPDDRAQLTVMMVMMTGIMVGMSQMGAEMGGELGEAFTEEMSDEEKAEARRHAEEAAKQAAEIEAKFKAILEKHGAARLMADDAEMPTPADDADPAELANQALEGIDQIALLKDLLAFMEEMSDEPDEQGAMSIPAGEITDLQINGDTATAMFDDEEAKMVKVDGRWYLHMEMNE